MAKSQKRRNTALMYEWLVKKISRCLVEGDSRNAGVALKILKKHFRPGTELHRELRLINAIVKTTVRSDASAASIIAEARQAATLYDAAKLDREKSLLIRNVNHRLNDDTIYEQSVPDFRTYSTVQTLLNEWRKPLTQRDISKVTSYEEQMINWLVSEKEDAGGDTLDESAPDTRLLVKVMMKKLHEKYDGALSPEQKALVRAYAFAMAHDDANIVHRKLTEIKTKLLECIAHQEVLHPEEEYTNKTLLDVRAKLLDESLEAVDDGTVSRFMLYTKLCDEISSEEKEEVRHDV
jgi:hypothetical protein